VALFTKLQDSDTRVATAPILATKWDTRGLSLCTVERVVQCGWTLPNNVSKFAAVICLLAWQPRVFFRDNAPLSFSSCFKHSRSRSQNSVAIISYEATACDRCILRKQHLRIHQTPDTNNTKPFMRAERMNSELHRAEFFVTIHFFSRSRNFYGTRSNPKTVLNGPPIFPAFRHQTSAHIPTSPWFKLTFDVQMTVHRDKYL